nr:DinB family protein [uncultured Mucilaginibacter sp.]
MTATELIILNSEEVRRRSIKLVQGIPQEVIHWIPDAEAMSIIEMVRHMLESEYIYNEIVKNRGKLGDDFVSPWEGRPFTTIADEIVFAAPYHQQFLESVLRYTEQDLDEIEVVRVERNQRRKLGDYLLRIAYHESVHAGNLLSYLRILNIDRPDIWD